MDFHRYDSSPTYLQIERRPEPTVADPLSSAQKVGALLRLFGWAAVLFALPCFFWAPTAHSLSYGC